MQQKKSPFPVMENMTVKMVSKYLEDKQSIIIPIGVNEQHGLHLPLKTDALIASHLGRMIGEETGILVAPTMFQSFSGGNCPGTINISPATMSLVMSDMLISLANQGFRNFYLWLCHGGSENATSLDNAIKMLLRNNPSFDNAMIALLPVWKCSSPDTGWAAAIKDGDWHAGWLETSMVMALEPDLVQLDDMALDGPEIMDLMRKHPDNYQYAQKTVDDEFVIPKMMQRPDVRIGVMGDPKKASVELGHEIIDDLIKNASAKISELESKNDGIYKPVDFTPEPLILG